MSLFGCESICQLVMHTWKRTKAAARSESSRGQAPGLPASLLGWHWEFLACVSLVFTCKAGMGSVYRCLGSPVNVWKMLSEQSHPSGSGVETLQLSSLAIACSC